MAAGRLWGNGDISPRRVGQGRKTFKTEKAITKGERIFCASFCPQFPWEFGSMFPNVTGLWPWCLGDEGRNRGYLACAEVMRKERAVWESGEVTLGRKSRWATLEQISLTTAQVWTTVSTKNGARALFFLKYLFHWLILFIKIFLKMIGLFIHAIQWIPTTLWTRVLNSH